MTGQGELNFNWAGNPQKSLEQSNIHLSDIGITHFIWQAGIIGFMWLVYGLSKLWLDIFRLRDYLIVTSYVVIATFTLPTIDMLLRRDSMFLFSIFLGMLANIQAFEKSVDVAEGA